MGLNRLETLNICVWRNAGLDTLNGISQLAALQHITLRGNAGLPRLDPDLFHLGRSVTCCYKLGIYSSTLSRAAYQFGLLEPQLPNEPCLITAG